jgi:hypothetical protein
MNKLLPGFSEGFPVALRVWLVFLLCLVLLGYSVPFSIVVGAVGGIASGWVVAWWNSKDEPSTAPSDSEPQDEPEEAPVKLSGLALAKQRREARARKRSQKSSIPLTGLLNRSK